MSEYKDWIVRFYASHKDIPKGHSDRETLKELVRCKDCKHNNSKSSSFVACVLVGEMYGRKADNYCSLAEVKEE